MAGIERSLFVTMQREGDIERVGVQRFGGGVRTVATWNPSARQLKLDGDARQAFTRTVLRRVTGATGVTSVVCDLGSQFDEILADQLRDAFSGLGLPDTVPFVSVVSEPQMGARAELGDEILVGIGPGIDPAISKAIAALPGVRATYVDSIGLRKKSLIERLLERVSARSRADEPELDVLVAGASSTLSTSIEQLTSRGRAPLLALTPQTWNVKFDPGQRETVVLQTKAESIPDAVKDLGSIQFFDHVVQGARDPLLRDNVLVLTGMDDWLPKAGESASAEDVEVEVPSEHVDKRRVDLELRQDDLAVEPTAACVAGQLYTIALSIGRTYAASIFEAPPPPIVPALGAEDAEDGGWQLEVALFGLDFVVVGATTQPLHLPSRAASTEVTFSLRAPSEVSWRRRFRIAVLRQHNLVQAFLVEWGPLGARAVIESVHVASFDVSANLSPRLVCLATNHDDATGEDHLMGVVDHQAIATNFDGETVAKHARKMANVLTDNVLKDSQHLWFPETRPATRSPQFHTTVRELARQGNEMYLELFKTNGTLKERLHHILGQVDGPIQTIRFRSDLTLPWSLLYDWELPANDSDVCTDEHCDHRATSKVFCLKGFWGVRLTIEEIDPLAERTDKPLELPRPPSAGRILLTTDRGADATGIETPLQAAGVGVVTRSTTKDELLDQLWQSPPTASTVVLVGHVERDSRDTERTHLVLAEGPPPEWLSVNDVVKRHLYDNDLQPLPEPGPLVLLLGCKTEVTDDGAMGSLPSDFLVAGAATVISTLCPINVGFVTDFSTELLKEMLSERRPAVGSALRQWRQQVASAGNPLALALVSSGETDLQFAAA